MVAWSRLASQTGKCRRSSAKQVQMKNSSSQVPTALTPTKNRASSLASVMWGQLR